MILKLVSLLCIVFYCNALYAQVYSDFKSSFYTDESKYYLKLYSNGFTKRFRVNQRNCYEISKASIVLRKSSNQEQKFERQQNLMGQNSLWPDNYGIYEEDYCWFQVHVNNIDLNRPYDNEYLIKIVTNTGEINYFTGYYDSLLPENRLLNKIYENTPWNGLGAMGANIVEDGGVFFKIWEPLAERVDLFVENSNSPIIMNSDKLLTTPLHSFVERYHVAYVTHAKASSPYNFRFVKNGDYETLEVANNGYTSQIKIDPFADQIIYSSKGGQQNGYINPWGLVTGANNYKWNDNYSFTYLNQDQWDNWIIYELWPLTFNPQKSSNGYQGGRFVDVVGGIPYLKDLGINAVELLPIYEARVNASWGYMSDSLNTIESTLGTPQELKYLIDNLHQNGIRAIFDVVINHVNNDLVREPLSTLSQSSKYYFGSNWGPIPDFRNISVNRWIMDSLLNQMREYHLDGFRFDMTHDVYLKNENGWRALQEFIKLLKLESPRIFTSAEELPDNVWVTTPVEENGLGFTSQWNNVFKNFFEEGLGNYRYYNRWANLNNLRDALLGYSDHQRNEFLTTPFAGGQTYSFGAPTKTVNYLGSHDFVGNENPLIRIVSGYDYKQRLGYSKPFARVRPLEDPIDTISRFKQIHNDFPHSVARLAYGILFTKPGNSLLFQGEEIASDLNIQNEWEYLYPTINGFPSQNIDINEYVSSHRMPWEYLNPDRNGPLSFLNDHERMLFTGHYNFFKDMIRFKKDHAAINRSNAYNVKIYDQKSIITYQITDGANEFFIIGNFGNYADGEWIEFPHGGSYNWWTETINSSTRRYGGVDNRYSNIISQYGGRYNHIRLAGSSFMLFKKQNRPEISNPLYLRGTFNNWIANDSLKLRKFTDNGLIAEFFISKTDTFEFKLGTANWEIDLGIHKNTNATIVSGKGQLSYAPNQQNIKVKLKKGSYRFHFDMKTYSYIFERK